ncbi:MAG: beta-N-acetylhexosaminidase [Gammaproteobacteria bacterium]|nr:MAG: beta-N-acetylhexosaminidase [Gammaproteobacteria bacterium]
MTLGPLMIDVQGLALTDEERTRLADPLVGGVILFSRNFQDREQLRALTASIRAVRHPAPLIAVDQEGGRVQRFRSGFTALPALRWLGHEYEQDTDRARHLAFACGWIMAAELVEDGVDFSFAPCVDIDWGVSGVIGDRALHRDPEAVASLALSYMQGMRSAGMAAVAKHFPGHGAVAADSHHELPVDRRSLVEIEEDMSPYRRLIDHGLGGVMVAHIRFPRVDARIASLSPLWLKGQLRRRLGFQGVIFTDDMSMAGAAAGGSASARVRQALEAGADMALVCNDPAAAAGVLRDLAGFSDPAAHARLVAMRARPQQGLETPALRERGEWKQATAQLAAALGRPPLELHG